MTKALFGPIDQIGYLVDDLDRGIARWIAQLGVGPWTVFRNVSLQGRYRGVEGIVTMDVALSYQGDVQIELIQATNATPSPYRNADGTPILGIHHIAWVVDDLDDAVARASANGLSTVFEASNPATNVAYLEPEGETGVLYEFIQGQGMREMIVAGAAAARAWDGSNPITTIG